MKEEKPIYFNTPQRLTQLIGANTTVIVAGRRTGKTDSIASPFVLRNMQRMPGSTGGIVVPTFKHGLTNTLPGLFAAWKRWGFIQGVHFVVGRKPPKSFARAIIEPSDYEHVISFYNGSVAIIISQDRPGSSNSLTLSWLLVDEAKFIDYERPEGRRLNVIKSFYVKFERKIPALIEEFCNYYAHHQNKTVVYYYDTTALGANYAVNDQDFHWVVCHEFEKHGWQVEDVYLGNPMRHDEKYLLINQGFAGKQRLMPFFNRQNNDDLILAIQSAGVLRGRNGFRKNKDGEKLEESEENLLQHRTDGSDAFDTRYIGCEKFPFRESFHISSGGVL